MEVLDPRIGEMASLLTQGIEAFEAAGRLLVDLLDENADAKDAILRAHPDWSEGMLSTLERIGRKQLYFRLCPQADRPGIRKLMRCAFSDQVRYYSQPLPLLVSNGDSLLMPVAALQSEQAQQVFGNGRVRSTGGERVRRGANGAQQVFGNGRVRSLGEQRAWLEARKPTIKELGRRRPYTISKGRVCFHELLELTTEELLRIATETAAH
ncbi:hypothetical protein ASA1KI_21100 [Opitutales bacterium ASA1]|nr:hypothetical protein ASA1KI_21100 [Opitutales bacterium ASA1]